MGGCVKSICEKIDLFPKHPNPTLTSDSTYIDASFRTLKTPLIQKDIDTKRVLNSKNNDSQQRNSISIEMQEKRIFEKTQLENNLHDQDGDPQRVNQGSQLISTEINNQKEEKVKKSKFHQPGGLQSTQNPIRFEQQNDHSYSNITNKINPNGRNSQKQLNDQNHKKLNPNIQNSLETQPITSNPNQQGLSELSQKRSSELNDDGLEKTVFDQKEKIKRIQLDVEYQNYHKEASEKKSEENSEAPSTNFQNPLRNLSFARGSPQPKTNLPHPYSLPCLNEEIQAQFHGPQLPHYQSLNQNLNALIDESDMSLMFVDSVKNSIFYGGFGLPQFKDSKFLLDESMIHPVKSDDIRESFAIGHIEGIVNLGEGIDSDSSSKKGEEPIRPRLKKEESTQDLINLLQFPTPPTSRNQKQAQSKLKVLNVNSFQRKGSADHAHLLKSEHIFQQDEFIQKLKTLKVSEDLKSAIMPPPTSQSHSNTEFKSLNQNQNEQQHQLQQSSNRTQDLPPVTEEENVAVTSPIHPPKKLMKQEGDFSFCSDSTAPQLPQPSPVNEGLDNHLNSPQHQTLEMNSQQDNLNKLIVEEHPINQHEGNPLNISIIISDPKNNMTEQLVFDIRTDEFATPKIELNKRASISSNNNSTFSEKQRDSILLRQIPQKSLLENTNRIVMQKRSLRMMDTAKKSVTFHRSTSLQTESQHEFETPKNSQITPVKEESQNHDTMISMTESVNPPNRFSTLEQNSFRFEEEQKELRKLAESNIINQQEITEIESEQDDVQIPLNLDDRQISLASNCSFKSFQNSQNPLTNGDEQYNQSDEGSPQINNFSPSLKRERSSSIFYSIQSIPLSNQTSMKQVPPVDGVSMHKSNSSEFQSCVNTPYESQRDSLVGETLSQKRNSQTKIIYKRPSLTTSKISDLSQSSPQFEKQSPFFDCENFELRQISGVALQNKNLIENPETYMEWLKDIQPLNLNRTPDDYHISSEILYQLEMIKQETYQDFMQKFEQEFYHNQDLFDPLIESETSKVCFRSELGFDQERLFILTGEYIVNTSSYASFYNVKNSLHSQKLLNNYSSVVTIHDDIQNTVLFAKSTSKPSGKQTDFVFLKHFSFLQQQQEEQYDENGNEIYQDPPVEQMCEIDISLNSEEIEHILKKNNCLSSSFISARAELFSGNITTADISKNQLKVEFMIEANLNNSITASQAKQMYKDAYQNYFDYISSMFP